MGGDHHEYVDPVKPIFTSELYENISVNKKDVPTKPIAVDVPSISTCQTLFRKFNDVKALFQSGKTSSAVVTEAATAYDRCAGRIAASHFAGLYNDAGAAKNITYEYLVDKDVRIDSLKYGAAPSLVSKYL